MHRLFPLLIAFLFCATQTSASTKVLNIGLYWGEEPTEITVTTTAGDYEVRGNGMVVSDMPDGQSFKLREKAGLVHLLDGNGQSIGVFGEISIARKRWGATVRIKHQQRASLTREFQDNLKVTSAKGKLRIINEVYIEHYVAGVVEAEAGSKEPKEYYKVQSVICRTYALNNRRRHEGEGFQLCDKVHCQVYKGRSRWNPDIIAGTRETIGIVIVDADINLITAAFSSNCGGYTCNSEDVWSGALSYLRAREDEYCLEENHSYWRHPMPKDEWLGYLKRKFNYPIEDVIAREEALYYCPHHREHQLNDSIAWVDFKSVRRDLRLQSAFFSIETVQDSVILEGRGYGHGVGLCQEGAMNMAKQGMSYDQILMYYYDNIHLVNLSVIDFFRSD